jgi:membrane-bound inhibitor of C-type lysozyme
MARSAWAALATLALTASAAAGTIPIEVDGEVSRESVVYDCAGARLEVEYINSRGNALAVLGLADGPLVMANVLSASGARYAGGRYIWWTRGDHGDLYDLMQGEDAEPVSCEARRSR